MLFFKLSVKLCWKGKDYLAIYNLLHGFFSFSFGEEYVSVLDCNASQPVAGQIG